MESPLNLERDDSEWRKMMRIAGFLIAGTVLLGGIAGCGTAASGTNARGAEQMPAEIMQETTAAEQEAKAVAQETTPVAQETAEDEKGQADSEIINLSFDLTDFNLLGYDVFVDHFADICGKVGCPVQELTPLMETTDSVFGKALAWSSEDSGRNMRRFQFMPKDEYFLEWTTDFFGNEIRCYRNSLFTEKVSTEEMSERLDVSLVSDSPVTLGDSYEEWHNLIRMEEIKEKGVQIKDGETDELSGDIVDEYCFRTKWGEALYSEWQTRFKEGDDALYCGLSIYLNGDEGSALELGEADCFIVEVIFDSNQKVGSWEVKIEYGDE